MKYIINESSKPISKIGLGISRYGTLVDKAQSYDLLDLFLHYGGNVIDTARNYYEWVDNGRGKGEQLLGDWMQDRQNRDLIVVSTKGGVRNCGKVFTADLSKDNLTLELQESLDSLRTNYLDIYLLHRDEPDRPIEEIIETVQEIVPYVKNGLIGVSNWSAARLKAANSYALQHGLHPFKVVQTWWSISSYTETMWGDPTTTWMDDEMYQYCIKNQILAMGYTSQAKGFFQKAISVGLNNIDEMLKYRASNSANLIKLQHMDEYCRKNHLDPTAVVSGYITSNPLSGIALISTSNPDHLSEIMRCADYNLPISEIEWYDRIDLIQNDKY